MICLLLGSDSLIPRIAVVCYLLPYKIAIPQTLSAREREVKKLEFGTCRFASAW